MSKLIYMAQSVVLLSKIDNAKAEELIKNGEIKTQEDGSKYLIVKEDEILGV